MSSDLRSAIFEIGRDMVNCKNQCRGVGNDKDKGIIPRCLYFEDDSGDSSRGAVVVGINPGNSWSVEQRFYKVRGASYESVLAYWDSTIKKLGYYSKLRLLVRQLGFGGSILWTELVKCEDAAKGQDPPLQTFRVCTMTYLRHELELIPADWPLIAVSREAYKALSYLYPVRVVIGIPHPTAARGQFWSLFDNRQLRNEFKRPFSDWWDGAHGKAGWADTRDGHFGYR